IAAVQLIVVPIPTRFGLAKLTVQEGYEPALLKANVAFPATVDVDPRCSTSPPAPVHAPGVSDIEMSRPLSPVSRTPFTSCTPTVMRVQEGSVGFEDRSQ